MKALVTLCLLTIGTTVSAGTTVVENSREIPVAHDVDVVVVGGSARAVAAAVAAKESGATVFLAAQRPYLGADLCATWRLWLESGERPVDGLAKSLFGEEDSATPMNVKRTLDEALLEADIPFLFGCYVTDILCDADGGPAGIVMANRSGRQAVIAKVVIDATDRAAAARLAGRSSRLIRRASTSSTVSSWAGRRTNMHDCCR